MDLEKKFERIRKKYEIGIYKELDLATQEEKRKKTFPIEMEKKQELIDACRYHLSEEEQQKMKEELKESLDLQAYLSYFHHHFLEGNSLFRYAIEKCSTRWAIEYFEERKKPYQRKEPPENVLYSFLTSCAEKGSQGTKKVRFSQIEYYLYLLELEGKIERQYQTIYIKEENNKKTRQKE